MKLAMEQGELGRVKGEIPIGAVIVRNGEILSLAHNEKESLKDPTAHAEILAIQRACKKVGDWRLYGAEMYVTLEPCPMCASAIEQSRIAKLHIGTFNRDMGACGTIINIIENPYLNNFVECNWLYDERCTEQIVSFFKKRREENKE
ncbi:MAG: nucleoside deaminase [Clostridium sp.]